MDKYFLLPLSEADMNVLKKTFCNRSIRVETGISVDDFKEFIESAKALRHISIEGNSISKIVFSYDNEASNRVDKAIISVSMGETTLLSVKDIQYLIEYTLINFPEVEIRWVFSREASQKNIKLDILYIYP